MNTEDKIPTPIIAFPNKATLKRKPLVQTCTSVAAAAAVVVALGLGYFFSQWSAPPVVVVAQAPTEAPVVVAPKVKPEEPIVEKSEPVVTITRHTPQAVVEHATIENDTPVTRNIIEPIATHIEPMIVELAVNTPPKITTQVEEVLIAEPNPRERLPDLTFMSEYGSDIAMQIKQIPQGIVKLAQSYTRPFNKINKKQE